MIEVLDKEFYTVGYRLTDEEAATISYALGFFACQVRNGNYPVNAGKELVARQAIQDAEDLASEIENGSRVITAEVSQIVLSTHLNYLWRMHARMDDRNYESYCGYLGVDPHDLQTNAVAAYRIMQGYDTEIRFHT